MLNYAQIFISLICMLNPILAVTFYLNMTQHFSKKDKLSVAIICGATVFAFLTFCLFAGEFFMEALSIHIYSLQLGGGVLILILGICTTLKPEDIENDKKDSIQSYDTTRVMSSGISPLAIPIIIGPSSMVMTIIYGQQANTIISKVMIAGILFLICLVIILTLHLSAIIRKIAGEVGILAMTKIMGLIITAIAFEMIIAGIKAVIPIVTAH